MRRLVRVLIVAATATAVAVPLALALTSFTHFGALASGDPDQTGKLSQTGNTTGTTCASPKATPSAADSTARDYDLYRFMNTNGSPACIKVTVDARGCSAAIGSTLYAPGMNPASLTSNYIADVGINVTLSNSAQFYSGTVPANSNFAVSVFAQTAGVDCNDYSITVDGPDGIIEKPTAVGIAAVSARRTTRGVLVSWRAAQGLQVAGYHLYRERAGKRVRLNARLIAAAAGVHSRTYLFVDRNAPATPRYWLQTVGLNGVRTWRGPIAVAPR